MTQRDSRMGLSQARGSHSDLTCLSYWRIARMLWLRNWSRMLTTSSQGHRRLHETSPDHHPKIVYVMLTRKIFDIHAKVVIPLWSIHHGFQNGAKSLTAELKATSISLRLSIIFCFKPAFARFDVPLLQLFVFTTI